LIFACISATKIARTLNIHPTRLPGSYSLQLHPGQNRYKMRQLTPMPFFISSSPSPAPAPSLPRLRLTNPGKLCVAIQAASPAELIERAESALEDSSFLELRMDLLY
jgi:molybdenum cofactor biosynthesis enzyme MoaA